MTINTKELKKYRRNDVCPWCQFPLAFAGRDGMFHDTCITKPDYHDFQGYWEWQDKVKAARPRMLSLREKQDWERFQEWRAMKMGDIMYD